MYFIGEADYRAGTRVSTVGLGCVAGFHHFEQLAGFAFGELDLGFDVPEKLHL